MRLSGMKYEYRWLMPAGIAAAQADAAIASSVAFDALEQFRMRLQRMSPV